WNYLKYLMVLPLMIGLVMLFSFNFAQQLPDEITQPIEEAGKLAENLKEANLFSSLQEGEKVSLEWGNYTCECFEDQVKGYYRCRSLELTTNALKNLMKKSEAFTLLKDETSTSYENVRVIINRTLKVRGTFTQLEEVPQEFKAALPFIKKSRSGDILSLVFDSKQGKEMYKFNIVLNNKNEEVAYDYMVKVGNQYFGIDMMNKEGIKYMTPETYEQIIDQPIEVIRNGKEVIPVKSISFGNSRTQIIENRDSYKLTDFIYGKRIVPGNRMEMKIVLEDDYRFDLTMILKKRKVDLSEEAELMEELEEPAPDLVFQWGDRAFSTKKMILLSTKELESLKDQPISFKFDGETQNVVDVEHMYSTENKNAYSKYKTYVVNELYSGEVEPRDWKEVFYELVAELESSSTLSLSSIRLKNGLFTGVFISVLDEMDWSELYLGDQSYEKYDEATGLVALQRPDLIDLEKLKNLKFFKNRPPYISVNGRPVFSSDRKDFFAEASFDNEDVIFVHIPKPGSHDVVGALGFGPGMSGLLEVRMKSNTFDKKILWTDVKADNPVPFKNLDEVNKKINDNISTFEIPTEARTPVQATQVGLVTKVVNESDDVRGRHIEVTHSDGGKTIYGQLGIIEVAKGDHIKKTTIIGLTGEKPFLYQIITSQEENRINYPQGYPVKLTAQSEVGADVSINSVRKSSDFGDRTHPIFQTIKFHTGVDFAGPQGTAVFATANGMVSQVDDVDAKKGFEKYVLIGHGGNIETFYGHIISDLKVGDEIKKGQQIGTIMKDHLHYELRKNGRAINPKSSFVELKK
ncbi:MAG: peptidoglycan DD-metalloendopeptidase family protein, partial [Bacteroidota bacterium]